MSVKHVPPSVSETAFSCAHCGAFTTQFWYKLGANKYGEESRVPNIPDAEFRKMVASSGHDAKIIKDMLDYCDKIDEGFVFFEKKSSGNYYDEAVTNLNLSKCYNCKKISVWVYKNLVYPSTKIGILPSEDCPSEIMRDFEEARGILNLSPRGSAALLRLCVQKLCAHLGERGKDINADIASLVTKGLNPTIQKALDAVRVIGNEAVHPGELDLRDDRDTAMALLKLVNLIVESMITMPKSVEDTYSKIPGHKMEAIEQRNAKALKSGA